MLVIIALPINSFRGIELQKEQSENINLEYILFKADGSQIIEEINMDKNDIALFNEIFPKIFEKIISNNYSNINDIIDDLEQEYGQNNILSIIAKIRPLQKRVFIISNGYGSKFDLRLRMDLSIRKRLSFWYYTNTNESMKNSRTIIVDPIPRSQLQFSRLIEGKQIGMMKRFTGFYIRIPGNYMEDKQSHTFFFGYAVKVRAFDLPNQPSIPGIYNT